jgi:hypothetical protein
VIGIPSTLSRETNDYDVKSFTIVQNMASSIFLERRIRSYSIETWVGIIMHVFVCHIVHKSTKQILSTYRYELNTRLQAEILRENTINLHYFADNYDNYSSSSSYDIVSGPTRDKDSVNVSGCAKPSVFVSTDFRKGSTKIRKD